MRMRRSKVSHRTACIYACIIPHALTALEITLLAEAQKSQLFPKELQVTTGPMRLQFVGKGSGGWADPRDHQLCMDIVGAH
jgi:hypothetical protein